MREEFARSARSYLVYLFRETQSLKGLTADIIKGLGAFDLNTLLVDPPELGTYCLRQLFSSFRLRGYYDVTEESECLDEYVTFMDSVRQQYPGISQPSLLIADTVDFLMGQESLQTRPLLHKHFRLSCLCLDVPFPQLPGVKFWNVDSEDPTSQLIDLVQPVQSYYANVARGVEVTTSDDSVSKFLALEPNFGSTALSDVYFPWLSVDFFDSAKIHKSLIQPVHAHKTSSPQLKFKRLLQWILPRLFISHAVRSEAGTGRLAVIALLLMSLFKLEPVNLNCT